MNIPKLNRSNRSREYLQYNQVIIDNIVYDYLFYGLSHRKLDEKYSFIHTRTERKIEGRIIYFISYQS